MPIESDASLDAAAAPLAQLEWIFDAPLHRAAQQLIALGGVSDVRVLQNGRVVTGIAGERQRVYVRYQRAAAPTLQGECSCGERSPCVHVAAVVITAATLAGARTTDGRRADNDLSTGKHFSPWPPASTLQQDAPRRQSLRYLIEPDHSRGFHLSVWVTQSLAGSGDIQPGTCLFAPGIGDGSRDYPRYVDARDREILDVLAARHFGGPRHLLTGAAGFDVLQRVLATGHAMWRSLQGSALRWAGARRVLFAWRALPNGDQRLRCESSEVLDFLLELEPAVYIDTACGDCGPLDLPYPRRSAAAIFESAGH